MGMSKAGFGGAAGIAAIPVMGSVMTADHMLGVMLPLLIAADIVAGAFDVDDLALFEDPRDCDILFAEVALIVGL